MTIQEFIFSEQFVHRIYRHAVFWIAYCIFFFIQSFVPSDYSGFFSGRTYLIALKSILHFVPACIISVYLSLYYILPVFLEKKKIAQSALAILLLFAFATCINYFFSAHFHQVAVPNIEPAISFNIILGLAYLNAIWAFIITGIALGIKVTKKWLIQQRALAEIQKKNIRTHTDLQKSRVLPDFLLASLNRIQQNVDKDRNRSAQMVLWLSDILSYILYESTEEQIEIRRELFILQQFISLQNSCNTESIQLEIDAQSDVRSKYMTPLSVLSVVQYCTGIMLPGSRAKIRISSGKDQLRIRMYCDFCDQHANSIADTPLLHSTIEEWIKNIYSSQHSDVRVKNIHDGILILLSTTMTGEKVMGSETNSNINKEVLAYV